MAILISIRPEFVEKILNGEKTIEIRKTKPKCELPCKVYVYCTKGIYSNNKQGILCYYNNTNKYKLFNKQQYEKEFCFDVNGKIVGEFILNEITDCYKKTRSAIMDLVSLTPNVARVITKEGTIERGIDEIRVGNTIECLDGQIVAVDGVVTKGESYIDESMLTGESVPRKVVVGDRIMAGTINVSGVIEYSAEKIGRDSTISSIVNSVVEASNTKMKVTRLADKVSSILIPTILTISILCGIIYLIIGAGINVALTRFVTILVVACPCSLGLATPLAIVISSGLCAKNGILIKKSETFETLGKVNCVVFDKTGTLTYGKLKVVNQLNCTELNLLDYVYSLETKSTHPIALALTNYANENDAKLLDVYDFENLIGMGLCGVVEDKQIIVGNEKLLKSKNVKIDSEYIVDRTSVATRLYVAVDGKFAGFYDIEDEIRADAKKLISALKQRNIRVIMLTGDSENVAQNVAERLNIEEIISNVMPNEKLEFISRLKSEGNNVLMCGDGINDSPALSLADLGLTISSATDIAKSSADIILKNNNLIGLIDLMNISTKTIWNVRENLFWAFVYNLAMILIATGAFSTLGVTLTPMMGAIAMTLSSICVIINALRLKLIKVGGKNETKSRDQNSSTRNAL